MPKTTVIFGERIAINGELRLGCSATIFDPTHKKVLLTKRKDNGQWCLPGGRVEAGETVSEACIREVWEETGLHVEISRLIGIYSDPNKLVVYPDGHKVHVIALSFDAKITGGEPGISNETTDWGYFSSSELEQMDLLAGHLERIQDAFKGETALIK